MLAKDVRLHAIKTIIHRYEVTNCANTRRKKLSRLTGRTHIYTPYMIELQLLSVSTQSTLHIDQRDDPG